MPSSAIALVSPDEPFDPRRIPIELQAWWAPNFGHIHAGTRLPLGQTVSGTMEFDVRIVLHDNPSQLVELRFDDDGGVIKRIPLDHECPYDGVTSTNCSFNVPVSLDTRDMRDGWRELRIRATADTPDGKRYLNSSGVPLLVDNGGSRSDYNRWCNNTSLIGRGWYEGFGYSNAIIECVPQGPISGVHTFEVRAQKASAHLTVALDKTHHIPPVGPWPTQHHSAGQILFSEDGDFGSFFPITIDTDTLSPGWHTLAVTSLGPDGGTSDCTFCAGETNHPSGVAKIWFYVEGGNGGGGCTNDAECDDGLFCNGQESCSGGSCVSGSAVDCNDGVGCTQDSCDEGADSCVHQASDAVCDNGVECDGTEVCDTVLDCQVGDNPNGCELPPDCVTDADCNDGLFCTGSETCVNQSCVAGAAVTCDDGVACTQDSCNEASDTCVNDTSGCGSGGSGAALKEVQEGGSSGSTLVQTANTLQAVAGDLYLAAISYKPNTSVMDVSGLGLSWVRADEQCGGRHQTGISVWWAQGTPSGSGTVTATMDTAPSNAVIAVSRYSGVSQTNPVGNAISGNTNGADGGCSGGTDSTSYSMDLPVATANATAYSAVALRHRSHSPGAGYTETVETSSGSGGNAAGAAVQEQSVAVASNTPVDGSFSSRVDWAVVGLEIRSGDTAVGCASDAECDDALFCNGDESCVAGSCFAGVAVSCDDGVACTADSCDDGSGCLHVEQHDVCDNGLACDGTETCHGVLGCQSSGNPGDCGTPSDVSLQEVVDGSASSSATVSTSGSLTAAAGDLYLAAVSYKPNRTVTGVSGLGLGWTLVDQQCSGRSQTGISVWKAQGTPTASGPVTATLDQAPSNAVIAVSRYSGVNPTAAVGGVASANTNGSSGGCSGGSDNGSYSVNLPVAASGSLAYGAVALRHRRHTPGAGFTETVETSVGSGGSVAGAALQERLVATAATVPVDGSFSSTLDWAAVGVEIRAGSAAASSASTAPAALGALLRSAPNECTEGVTCEGTPAAADSGSSGSLDSTGSAESATSASADAALARVTDASLTVAFIGDTGSGRDASAVWELVRDQGADMILHQGGLAHGVGGDADAVAWQQAWEGILGANFPYFHSVGDADLDAWQSTYRPTLEERIDLLGADCTPFDEAGNAACTYRGLFFVLSGGGRLGASAADAAFIRNALQRSDAVWSVCSWHHNQQKMQIGGSADDVGWGPYEACREGGAVIATAHDHAYARTRTLVATENPVVDPDAPEAHRLRTAPGATFAFVNGLGGVGVGNQERCLPTSFPYGCAGEWAKIYTGDHGARPGVLFLTFHVDGDPGLARGVFMNVDGQIVDTFDVRSELGN